ncbi:MAG: hypothetical protein RBR71_13480 [Gudongella sp.]|nr:hypothetical protein [Gudongella sp.]
MTEYLPSIVLLGLIVIVIIILGAFIIGLYFMIKRLILFNDSLKNKTNEE